MKVFGLCVNCIICSLDFRYTEAVVRRCSSEQALLKISQCWSFLLIKLQAFRHSEICKIFKSIFFTKHLRWLLLVSGNILWTLCLLHNANDESFHCVVRIGSPALISFYCVCFVSFYFFLFFYFFVDFTSCLGIEISLSIFQIKHCSCS